MAGYTVRYPAHRRHHSSPHIPKPDLKKLLTDLHDDEFDFISIPLTHPRHRRDSQRCVSRGRVNVCVRADEVSARWLVSHYCTKYKTRLYPLFDPQEKEYKHTKKN